MPRQRGRAREFQMYFVPLVGSAPLVTVGSVLTLNASFRPSDASFGTETTVGIANIAVGIAVTVLLLAGRGPLRLLLAGLVTVAVLLGATAVLATVIPSAAGPALWFALLWLLIGQGIVLAGVGSMIIEQRSH